MTDRIPLVEQEDVLDEKGNWIGTQIVYLGLTGTQIRGLKEFYTTLTGRGDTDIPEIGAIRDDRDRLREVVAPAGIEPAHPKGS